MSRFLEYYKSRSVSDFIRDLKGRIDELKEENRQLKEMLRGDHLNLPLEWNLPPTISKIIKVLLSQEAATTQEIFNTLYFDDPNGGPDSPDIIQVHISLHRKKLKEFGIEIKHLRERGYYIVDKEEVLKRLER